MLEGSRPCTIFCFAFMLMHELRNQHIAIGLLVSSSVRSKQLLCFVHGQGQKSEQKHTTKNFDEFHNHSPLLTMLRFRANYLDNLRGYPFSFVDHANSPCKDLLFPRGPSLAQKPLHLVGTVLKFTFVWYVKAKSIQPD